MKNILFSKLIFKKNSLKHSYSFFTLNLKYVSQFYNIIIILSKNTVSIDELMSTIKKIRGVTGDIKDKRLILVLESLDKDHDGKIDDLNDVLKVFY